MGKPWTLWPPLPLCKTVPASHYSALGAGCKSSTRSYDAVMPQACVPLLGFSRGVRSLCSPAVSQGWYLSGYPASCCLLSFSACFPMALKNHVGKPIHASGKSFSSSPLPFRGGSAVKITSLPHLPMGGGAAHSGCIFTPIFCHLPPSHHGPAASVFHSHLTTGKQIICICYPTR